MEFLTTKQAAKLLGVCQRHVWWMFRRGYLRGTLISPRMLLIERASLKEARKRPGRGRPKKEIAT